MAPAECFDAITGAKIRPSSAPALSLTSFGIADIVPGRIVVFILAGLTAAELGLYIARQRYFSNDRPQAQAHPARRAHPDR